MRRTHVAALLLVGTSLGACSASSAKESVFEETRPTTTVTDPAPETTTTVASPETSTTSPLPTNPTDRETVTVVPVSAAAPEVLVGEGPTIEWFDISDTTPLSSRAAHVSSDLFYLPGLVDSQTELHGDPFTSVWVSGDGLTWEQYPIDLSEWASARHMQFHEMTLAYAIDHFFSIVDLETGAVSISHIFDEPITNLAYGERGIFVSTHGERKYTYEHFFDTVVDDVAFREAIGSAGIEDGIFYASTDTEDRQWILADHGFEQADFDVLERSWYSIDGVDWTLVADHGDSTSGNIDPSSGSEDFIGVIATESGFFATAWAFDGNRQTSENAWYSADGINWIDQGCCAVSSYGTWGGNAVGQLERGPHDELLVNRPGGVERVTGLPSTSTDPIRWAPSGALIVGIQWLGYYPEWRGPRLYFSLDAQQWTVLQPAFEGDMYDFLWHWNDYFPANHIVATDTAILLTTFGHDDEHDLPPWRWLGIVKDN